MSNVRIDLKSAENMAPKAYIVIFLRNIRQNISQMAFYETFLVNKKQNYLM